MLTRRLLQAGGLLTLGGAKLDNSLFIRAPRGGLFSLDTVVMVNTRASRDTWMWHEYSLTAAALHSPSGTLSGVTSKQIINLFLSSPVILLSSDNQAVKFLNINAKYIMRGSGGLVCKAARGNHETIKHVVLVVR